MNSTDNLALTACCYEVDLHGHHGGMEAYSEDLRKRIVDAVEHRGMGQSEAARTFDCSLSSVKRYVRKFRQGRSLFSPGKAPGTRPKREPNLWFNLGVFTAFEQAYLE